MDENCPEEFHKSTLEVFDRFIDLVYKSEPEKEESDTEDPKQVEDREKLLRVLDFVHKNTANTQEQSRPVPKKTLPEIESPQGTSDSDCEEQFAHDLFNIFTQARLMNARSMVTNKASNDDETFKNKFDPDLELEEEHKARSH